MQNYPLIMIAIYNAIAIKKRQKEGSTRQPAPNHAAELVPESAIDCHPEPDKAAG